MEHKTTNKGTNAKSVEKFSEKMQENTTLQDGGSKMHINSVGSRAIARIKDMHHSLVSTWIKKMGLLIKEEFSNRLVKFKKRI